MNLTNIHEDTGCSLDLALLWLWCRPAATSLIGSLAWEPPYAEGVALKKKKKTPQKNLRKKIKVVVLIHSAFKTYYKATVIKII